MNKPLPGKLAPAALAKLRQEHDDYIAGLIKAGMRVLTYRAPCCGSEVATAKGQRGQVWDTIARCPECGRMHVKITKGAKAYGFIPESHA